MFLSRKHLQNVLSHANIQSMKKRPPRNVSIKPSTHDLVRAAKKRSPTKVLIKDLVDRALVQAYGKQQASA